MSAVCLPIAWRGLNAGSCTPLPRLVCPQPLCPTRVFPPLGRRDPSPERTLLLRLRSYRLIRRSRWALSSLRLLASFGESLQVVTSPCCPRQLPDVISDSLFLDAGSPTPAVHRVLSPVSSTMSSAFPRGKVGRLPAIIPLETTSCGGIFEVADISLCSGLQVCSPPISSLPLRILPQGSRGFYVRAKRGSLPPRASDMLTARRQAIGGTGTCTPLDCGLVGYSFPRSPLTVGSRTGASLGRCLCSPLSRPFVCECHIISTVPRFQSPPRQT